MNLNRYHLKRHLKEEVPLLIGFQEVLNSTEEVYVWLLHDLRNFQDFVDFPHYVAANTISYIKPKMLMEDAAFMFAHYELTLKQLKNIKNSEHNWVTAEGKARKFIPMLIKNPTQRNGEPLNVKVTMSLDYPKQLKTRLDLERDLDDFDYANIIAQYQKKVNTLYLTPAGDHIGYEILQAVDKNNNDIYEEYEIVIGNPNHKTIKFKPKLKK